MKKLLLVLHFAFYILHSQAQTQNVGIDNSNPLYKLDVTGTAHITGDCYVGGYLGVNTMSPAYRVQLNNGSLALYNTTNAKAWVWNYTSSGNYFYLDENSNTRLVVANGGNVGIGTTAPAAKLEVNGNTIIDGTITTNGKCIISNSSATQLKYYTQQSTAHAILGPFGTSIEGNIAIPSGIFTTAPKIFVGDIVSTGGSVGTLFRVQLVTYDATPTGCHFRLINTSNGNVD